MVHKRIVCKKCKIIIAQNCIEHATGNIYDICAKCKKKGVVKE